MPEVIRALRPHQSNMRNQGQRNTLLLSAIVLPILMLIGGLLLPVHTLLGGILCVAGIGVGIFLGLAANRKRQLTNDQLDVQAQLLVDGGLGNSYLNTYKTELEKYGRSDLALEHLMKAVEVEPESPEATTQLADVLALSIASLTPTKRVIPKNLLKYASKMARKARRLNPKQYSPCSSLGMLCDTAGKHQEARKWFVKAGAKGDPAWRIKMCTSYGMEGLYEEALAQIEQVVSENNIQGWLVAYWHGMCLLKVGQYSLASSRLLQAYCHRGLKYEILDSLRQCSLMQARVLSASRFCFLAAIAMWHRSRRRSFCLFGEALLDSFTFALLRASRLCLPLTRRSRMLRKVQFRLLPPYEPEAQISMEAYHKGHMAEGLALIDRAIAATPDVPDLWGERAKFLIDAKRYDEAADACERALRGQPGHPVWTHNRSLIELLKSGKISEARRVSVTLEQKQDGSQSIAAFRRWDN